MLSNITGFIFINTQNYDSNGKKKQFQYIDIHIIGINHLQTPYIDFWSIFSARNE